ncbi:MAG: tryptophan--tRNA ligase [Alphaproteobacteria bacterium]|nr:tryptophan--tRNA ligase [Alphaproteobacteria bacterium]
MSINNGKINNKTNVNSSYELNNDTCTNNYITTIKEDTKINKDDVVLTGDRPTGCLHLGHYIGSLQNRVILQDQINDKKKCFVFIADVQGLSDNFATPEKVKKNVVEVCKDYISVGLDPIKSTIFIQSLIPELFELTVYYMNLITVSRLERCPTVKAELQTKSFSNSVPSGFLNYPVSQAADITAFKATAIPVGEDQKPVLEISNEIVNRFNNTYNTNILKECKAILSNVPRLVGIDGLAKASKSLGNAIMLCDDSDTIKKKVFSMYTDPNHINISDPGTVEGNVVFTYLDAFYDNKEEVEDLKKQYRKGGLGDVYLKDLLYKTLEEKLTPIREKRLSLNEDYIYSVLLEGSKEAREVSKQTLMEVREAIGIVY